MLESFVSGLWIDKTINISQLDIPLSTGARKHLIITGKNGSGKTSVLRSINNLINHLLLNSNNMDTYLKDLNSYYLHRFTMSDPEVAKKVLRAGKGFYDQFGGTILEFSNLENLKENIKSGKFIIAFFDAKRNDAELKIPSGINKFSSSKLYRPTERASQNFIQYLVNLKAEKSFASDEKEYDIVKEIDVWFAKFENRLRYIFDTPSLILKFNRKQYNFEIIEKNKLPYTFQNLPAGYSSIISIVSELLMRMEAHDTKSYDMEGLILIDELETHLHVDLQKKVFPFLIDFFPRMQFIITTHSPFILSSIENTIICDLEKRIVTEDLSGYSYEALIESYFNSDKYSILIKQRLQEYEQLMSKNQLNETEEDKLEELEDYFNNVPKVFSPELEAKLQQIKLNNLGKIE